MLSKKAKRELELVKAFHEVFCGFDGKLSPAGVKVLAFLRDEAGARGELGRNGVPYFYDAQNRFDTDAAVFLLGKRRIFDLMVKYLALDEMEVFALAHKAENAEAELDI